MARAPAPPKDLPGWRLVSGKLVEDRTVNGCIARGEVILARCKTDQCRRQVTVDLIAYQKIGFGKTEISEVQKAWSCGAGRCELSWVHGQYTEHGAPRPGADLRNGAYRDRRPRPVRPDLSALELEGEPRQAGVQLQERGSPLPRRHPVRDPDRRLL